MSDSLPIILPQHEVEYQEVESAFGEIEAILADVFVDSKMPLPEEEEDDNMDYGCGDCS